MGAAIFKSFGLSKNHLKWERLALLSNSLQMNVMKNFNNSKIKSTAKCTARSIAVESTGIPYHMFTSNKTLGQKLKIQERKRCFEEKYALAT